MGLGKQAKILTEAQVKAVLAHLGGTKSPERNRVIFLLSVDAGLRAKEIASITWQMVTDAEGILTDQIALQDGASKGRSGGRVYMSRRLIQALHDLRSTAREPLGPIVLSSRTRKAMSPNTIVLWFSGVYQALGFEGCSSHSGRRTAITRWARKISSVGGSIRDVQVLARHSSLQMTQRYIEVSEDAMRRVVD